MNAAERIHDIENIIETEFAKFDLNAVARKIFEDFEARITTLESDLARTTSDALLIGRAYDKRGERIKELEAELAEARTGTIRRPFPTTDYAAPPGDPDDITARRVNNVPDPSMDDAARDRAVSQWPGRPMRDDPQA